MKRIALLTGPPRVGKTTLIIKLLPYLPRSCGGFYTQEIRRMKNRVGFKITSLVGKEEILAHVDFKSKYRIGSYGVNIPCFEDFVLPLIEDTLKNKDWLVIDEIGPMELCSQKFKGALFEVFKSQLNILATITTKTTPFLANLKSSADVEIIEISQENRDHLFTTLKETFEAYKS